MREGTDKREYCALEAALPRKKIKQKPTEICRFHMIFK
jgi:hypothetical protein